MKRILILFLFASMLPWLRAQDTPMGEIRPHVIVTTDGEEDDRSSMVRFLLSSCDFDVEAIVNTSSQFHWEGGKGWNALHPVGWIQEQIELYREVYPNLICHDSRYPEPDSLLARCKVGNIGPDGEMEERTEGAEFIASLLLNRKDRRPIWIQAWGGCNTIARALKIIEEDHPERMGEVIAYTHLFLIWEQDDAYQKYIRPRWEELGLETIISDQFDCFAYIWDKVLPAEVQTYMNADWIANNIVGRGALCNAYLIREDGAFNGEGDSPAFLHCITNGLRSREHPSYGGWGGRYLAVRNEVYMDRTPRLDDESKQKQIYRHDEGRYGIDNSYSKMMEKWTDPEQVEMRTKYFQPLWQWIPDIQNDFAARAAWCTTPDRSAVNHFPRPFYASTLINSRGEGVGEPSSELYWEVKRNQILHLDAKGSRDPDGDELSFHWYPDVANCSADISWLPNAYTPSVNIQIPMSAKKGQVFHMICRVSDNGTPSLARYIRVIVQVIK